MTPIAFLDPYELIASLPRRIGAFGEADKWGRRICREDWPEVENMLDRCARLSDRVEIVNHHLEMLDPGSVVQWHRRKRQETQFILALRSNPGVFLYDNLACNPLIGQLMMVNQGAWLSAMNLGETAFVSLVIEAKGRE